LEGFSSFYYGKSAAGTIHYTWYVDILISFLFLAFLAAKKRINGFEISSGVVMSILGNYAQLLGQNYVYRMKRAG
jgi:hypothetical protein